MKKALICLMACLMIAGCTSTRNYANLSAPVIGCHPDEIDIEQGTLIPIGGKHNWEAACKGKRYVCSYDSTAGVQCAEMFNPLK